MKKSLLFLAAVLLLILNVTAEPTGISTPTYNETEGFYEIGNWEDLLWISQNPEHWDKDYVQTANIDFGDASTSIEDWNDGKGWFPIGEPPEPEKKSPALEFTGTYDGGGNTIENLVIDREEEEVVGLFGFAKNAEITNIQLEDVFIKGDEGVGGITGVAEYTQIFNCSVSGIIDGCDYVGGIAGAMLDGEIHKSYNEANIVGIGVVGGIVGYLQLVLVNDSYNLGEITGYGGVGGLVGVGESIEDSSEPEKSSFSITNSYSAGITDQPSTKALEPAKKPLNSIIPRHNLRDQFPKEDPAGGVIGSLVLNGEIITNITNCFFDKEAVNLDEPIWDDQEIDGITGKTTAEMKDINTFSDSDWDISPDPDIPADYPFLAWENDSSKSPVWIIGTSTAAVPLSNTALYLSLALIGGFVFFRIYRIS